MLLITTDLNHVGQRRDNQAFCRWSAGSIVVQRQCLGFRVVVELSLDIGKIMKEPLLFSVGFGCKCQLLIEQHALQYLQHQEQK